MPFDNSDFLTLMDLRATLMPDGSPVNSYAELLSVPVMRPTVNKDFSLPR